LDVTFAEQYHISSEMKANNSSKIGSTHSKFILGTDHHFCSAPAPARPEYQIRDYCKLNQVAPYLDEKRRKNGAPSSNSHNSQTLHRIYFCSILFLPLIMCLTAGAAAAAKSSAPPTTHEYIMYFIAAFLCILRQWPHSQLPVVHRVNVCTAVQNFMKIK